MTTDRQTTPARPATEAGRLLDASHAAHLGNIAANQWRIEAWRKDILAIEAESHEEGMLRQLERQLHDEAEARSIPVAELDVERLRQAWWNLCVAPARDDARRWEPDRYNAGYFLQAVMVEYARLASPVVRTEEPTDDR